MQIVFLGAPGAGKGTQAKKIADELSIPHISTGDIFREAIDSETPLGKEAKKYVEQGKLVPDEIVSGIVKERLSQDDCASGFILDGYPRTLPQGESLQETLKEIQRELSVVLYLEVNRDELIQRLTGRRICRNCGEIYHVMYSASKEEGICDKCGGELYQRKDDSAETVGERLDVYFTQTEPLVKYYEEQGLLKRVAGEHSPKEVTDSILQALKG